jgi:pimeloyl-ACP methyl ester carboxylesterase
MIVAMGLLLSAQSFAASGGRDATPFDYHLRRGLESGRHAPPPEVPLSLTPGTYQEPIDHFGGLPGQTFAQRYWIDTEYATDPATAPVIYHICGEGDAAKAYFLTDNAIEWAKALHANLVWLEHRYYGTSLPFSDLSNEHLQYLTLDNVLEDLAGFQKWISTSQGWSGKWITVGGSYSGTVSAIYRLKHPELIVGALASSAPMIAGTGVPQDNPDDIGGLESTDPSSDTGERQWAYQACTKFVFWETDGFTIFDPSASLCGKLFGNAPIADSAAYNSDYEAPFISSAPGAPTNLLFTYGSDDIWTTIGVSQKINQNPGITISVIEGAGHHFDLNQPASDDSAAVLAARQQFLTMAKSWLGL